MLVVNFCGIIMSDGSEDTATPELLCQVFWRKQQKESLNMEKKKSE